MRNTVFYAWQSDLPNSVNRGFIRDAIERALKRVNRELGIEDAVRADQDTENVPGNPSIAETIMAKIDGCAIFIPDISIVARSTLERPLPNPNVLIEYGRATGMVGDMRIIPVFNEAYGDWQTDRPFDMQHKRKPITYDLPEEHCPAQKKVERDDLVNQLARAIKSVLENTHDFDRVSDDASSIDLATFEELRREYLQFAPSEGTEGRMTGFWIGAIVSNGPVSIGRPFEHEELFSRIPFMNAWLSGAECPKLLDTMDVLKDGQPSEGKVRPGQRGSSRVWERYSHDHTNDISGRDIVMIRAGRDASLLLASKSNFHNPKPCIYAHWIMTELANVYILLANMRELTGRIDLRHEVVVEIRYDERAKNIYPTPLPSPVVYGEWIFGTLEDDWPRATKVMASEPLIVGPFPVTADTSLTDTLKYFLDEIYMSANMLPVDGMEFEIINGKPME